MFVHLGKNAVVQSDRVVAIIDWNTLKKSDINRTYLDKAQRDERLRDVSEGRPHSVVITFDDVYLSTISSTTLRKRAENPHYLAWE
ncbi:MAG: DUF370 domain-containing protein [Firmicutes bacterium]|nr:DUF370 domain-containing protein [Bacillota bacterium]